MDLLGSHVGRSGHNGRNSRNCHSCASCVLCLAHDWLPQRSLRNTDANDFQIGSRQIKTCEMVLKGCDPSTHS